MKRYQSKIDPNLFFWVQSIRVPREIFIVVKGHNPTEATEAHDDWFHKKRDAEEIAQQLANES
jgi:hypothetical protein